MLDAFFMRFRWSDAGALEREIEEANAALVAARQTRDGAAEIDAACRLGLALTAADREGEAVGTLEPGLAKARALGDPTLIAWSLLYLATARQYLDERATAHALFEEGLEIAERNHLREVEHYLWHHRGRCFAEERNKAEARNCFEKALQIRLDLKNPRAERSREALTALDDL